MITIVFYTVSQYTRYTAVAYTAVVLRAKYIIKNYFIVAHEVKSLDFVHMQYGHTRMFCLSYIYIYIYIYIEPYMKLIKKIRELCQMNLSLKSRTCHCWIRSNGIYQPVTPRFEPLDCFFVFLLCNFEGPRFYKRFLLPETSVAIAMTYCTPSNPEI